MSVKPCRLPELLAGRHGLEFWNTAITHAEARIAIPGTQAAFSFRPGEPPSAKKAGFSIAFDSGQTVLTVMEDFRFDEWTGAEIAYPDLASLPASIRRAIDRGILETVLDQISEVHRSRIRQILPLDPARLAKETRSRTLSWLDVSIFAEKPSPICIAIGLAPCDLPELLGTDGVAPVLAAAAGNAGAIPIELQYGLGELTLPLEEVRGLERGDLLILEAKSGASVLYVTSPQARYSFTGSEGKWTCSEIKPHRFPVEPEHKGEIAATMEAEDKNMVEDPAIAQDQFGSIPVVLEFELGKLVLPVGELSQWRKGTIAELKIPPLKDAVEVAIKANGQWIGDGELVRLGDRLAVRVGRFTGFADAVPDFANAGEEKDETPQ